jgi:hypothetical protein
MLARTGSNRRYEYEVLFAPSTKFIIHDLVVLDSGKLLLRMRED